MWLVRHPRVSGEVSFFYSIVTIKQEVLFSIPDIMEWRYGKPHIKTWSSDYPNERSSRSFSMKGAEWRKKRR